MKYKIIEISICLLLILSSTSFASLFNSNRLQTNHSFFDTTPTSLKASPGWMKIFGGINFDEGLSVDQTTDGGYITTGVTASFNLPPNGSTSFDLWLIKTNHNGDKEWETAFGGTDWDQGRSIQQTTDGGYIIVGDTYSFGVGYADVYMIKTDENGNKIWEKTFGGTDIDYGSCVQQTTTGGYIIVGSTLSFGAGDSEILLINTDDNGKIIWQKIFGGASDDRGYSVQQTNDGGFILLGETSSFGGGGFNVWMIKTDNNGNKIWEKIFGGTNYDSGRSVQQTVDGGFIITGITGSFGAGGKDVWLIKTDNSGDKIWDKTFGGINDDEAFSVQQTSDEGYIITGPTYSFTGGGEDVWLIKTDDTGNEDWNRTFGWASHDISYSVQQTTDAGYIMTGYTFSSFGAGEGDLWLIKTDHHGVVTSPPNTPTITGETNGKIRTLYNYLIQTTDPDHDLIRYYIDWGDYLITETGLNESGAIVNLSHKWDAKHEYTVKVKAIDENYAESNWTTLPVKIPYSYNLAIPNIIKENKQTKIDDDLTERDLKTIPTHNGILYMLIFGFISIDGIIKYVERNGNRFYFDVTPVEKVTFIGIAYLTDMYSYNVFRLYAKNFRNITQITGWSPKILFVDDEYQQFSFFITPLTICQLYFD